MDTNNQSGKKGDSAAKQAKKKRKFRKIPADKVLHFVGQVQQGPTGGPDGSSCKPRKIEGADGTLTIK